MIIIASAVCTHDQCYAVVGSTLSTLFQLGSYTYVGTNHEEKGKNGCSVLILVVWP